MISDIVPIPPPSSSHCIGKSGVSTISLKAFWFWWTSWMSKDGVLITFTGDRLTLNLDWRKYCLHRIWFSLMVVNNGQAFFLPPKLLLKMNSAPSFYTISFGGWQDNKYWQTEQRWWFYHTVREVIGATKQKGPLCINYWIGWYDNDNWENWDACLSDSQRREMWHLTFLCPFIS